MKDPRDPPRAARWGAIAFIFAAILLFARLGDLPLISPDEGRNAEVAREMQESGAWLVPSFNGIPYLDKPAFYFRAVALSFGAFGENEWAARLPSALFALATLALLFLFCRGEYRGLTASLAVLCVASTPLFLAFGRMVIFDMPLAFFVLLSLIGAFQGEEGDPRRRRAFWALSAAAAAVATLIKGPVGFIVPGLTILVYGLARPAGEAAGTGTGPGWAAARAPAVLRVLRSLLSPLNLLIFFGLTLPWFLGVVRQKPDFLRYGLVEESFRRYSTGAFHRTAPFYYYAPVVLGTFFPWSLLLPEAIAAAWKSRRRWARADRFFITCALTIVLFFSTSQSKLPGYVLVAVISLGVLTARLFARALLEPAGRSAGIVRRGSLWLSILCAAGALFLLQNVIEPGRLQRLFHIRSAEFDRLQPAMAPVSFTLLGLSALALLSFRARRPALSLAVFSAFSLSLVTIDFGPLRSYAEAGSSRAVARAIQSDLAADGSGGTAIPVATLEYFTTGLPFYLGRPVVLISRDGRELTSNYLLFLLRHARGDEPNRGWPENTLPYDLRESWLDSRSNPVYLVAGRRGQDELRRLAAARGAAVRELTPDVWGALFLPGDA